MRPTQTPSICSRATVISNDGALARVSVSRNAMCDGCHQPKATAMSPCWTRTRTPRPWCATQLGAKAGDMVEISMDERVLLRGGVVLYLLPLVFMLAAIVLALKLKPALALDMSDDILALLAAVAGMVVSVPVVRTWSKRSKYLADNVHR